MAIIQDIDVNLNLQRLYAELDSLQRELDKRLKVLSKIAVSVDSKRAIGDLEKVQRYADSFSDILISTKIDAREIEAAKKNAEKIAIEIPVTADTSGAERAVQAVEGRDIELNITADAAQAQAAVSSLTPPDISVTVTADASQAEAAISGLTPPDLAVQVTADAGQADAAIKSIVAPDVEVEVTADTDTAEKAVRDAQGRFQKKTVLPVEADTSKAESEIKSVSADEIVIPVTADVSGAESSISGLVSGLGGQLSGALDGLFGGGGTISTLIGSGIGGAILAGVGAGIAGFGAAFSQGKEIENALLDLQNRTGATTEELGKLEEAAKSAFLGGVGESLTETIGIIGQVEVELGKVFTTEEIGTFTAQAAALGKTFDKDVTEIIKGAAPAIKEFGLSGEEAFQFLSLAFSEGTTASDDTLDTIREYSGVLKRTGFSALEFADGLRKLGESSAFTTDKFGDAIKEAEIRLNAGDIAKDLDTIAKGGDKVASSIAKNADALFKQAQAGQITLKDAIQGSNTLIEEAFNSGKITDAVRSQLQVAIAKTPAEDLGSNFFGRLFTPTNEADLQKRAQEAAERFGKLVGQYNSFDAVAKNLQLAFAEISQAVFKFSNAVLAPIAGALLEVFNGVREVLADLASGIDEFGTGGAETLQIVLGGAVEFIVTAFKAASAVIGGVVVGIINAINPIFERLKQFADFVTEELGGGVGSFFDAFDEYASILQEVGGLIGSLVTDVLASLFDILADLAEFTVSNVIGAFKLLGSVITSVGEFFGFFGDEAKAGAEATGEAGDAAKGATGFFGTLRKVLDTVGAAFGTLRSLIAGATAAFGAIAEAVRTAVRAFTEGNFKQAIDAFFGLGGNAADAFKKGFDDKSGSIQVENILKPFEESLSNIGDGFETVAREANKLNGIQAKQEKFTQDITALYQKQNSEISKAEVAIRSAGTAGRITSQQQQKALEELEAKRAKLDAEKKKAQDAFTESLKGERSERGAISKAQDGDAKAAEKAADDRKKALEDLRKLRGEVQKFNQDDIANAVTAISDAYQAGVEVLNNARKKLGTDVSQDQLELNSKFIAEIDAIFGKGGVAAKQLDEFRKTQNDATKAALDAITQFGEGSIQADGLIRQYREATKIVIEEETRLQEERAKAIAAAEAKLLTSSGEERVRQEKEIAERLQEELIRIREEGGKKQADAEAKAFLDAIDTTEYAAAIEKATKAGNERKIKAQRIALDQIEDDAQRSYELQLFDLEAALAKELEAAEGNERKRLEIQEKFDADRKKIEFDYQLETVAGAKVAYAAQEALISALNDTSKKEAAAAAQARIKELDKEQEALKNKLRSGAISYEEYSNRISELDAARLEQQKIIEENRFNLIDTLNTSLAASAASLAQSSLDTFNKMAEQGKVSFEKLGEAAAFSFGQAILAGQEAGGALKAVFKDLVTNAITALAPQIIALFTATIPPPFGTIAGTAAVAAIRALLASAISGFKDGVIDLQGPGTERSDSIPARLSRGESVINAKSTRKNKKLLQFINDGGDGFAFFASRIDKYAEAAAQQAAFFREYSPAGGGNVEKMVKAIGQQTEALSERFSSLEKSFYHSVNTNVEIGLNTPAFASYIRKTELNNRRWRG